MSTLDSQEDLGSLISLIVLADSNSSDFCEKITSYSMVVEEQHKPVVSSIANTISSLISLFTRGH